MRRAVLAMLMLAGCGQQSSDNELAGQTADVLRLLKQGDGAACTNPATIQTIRRIVDENYSDSNFYQWPLDQVSLFRAQVETKLEMVTLEGVDATTSKITCDGKFIARWQGEGGEAPITFDMQPALDSNDFIVSIYDLQGPQNAYSYAKNNYYQVLVKEGVDAELARETIAYQYRAAGNRCRSNESGYYSATEMSRVASSYLEELPPPADSEQSEIRACLLDLVAQGRAAEAQARAVAATPPAAPMRREDRIEVAGPPTANKPSSPTGVGPAEWSRRVAPEFPERAQSRGIESGSASVSCRVEASGSLSDCQITMEEPAGAGFGPAALAAASRSRVTPNGSVGGRIMYVVRFALGE